MAQYQFIQRHPHKTKTEGIEQELSFEEIV